MNTRPLEFQELCKREFSRIAELYSPNDILTLATFDPFDAVYQSAMFSDKKFGEGSYDNITAIRFVQRDLALRRGKICYVSVHSDARGRGFGRALVTSVENIFKQLGIIEVFTRNADNPSFWKHMGYSLSELEPHEGDEVWAKKL